MVVNSLTDFRLSLKMQVGLPTRVRKWTVRRSPFKYGKSKEQFEMKTYNRLVELSNATPKTVDTILKYVEQTVPPGVGVRITEFVHKKLATSAVKEILPAKAAK